MQKSRKFWDSVEIYSLYLHKNIKKVVVIKEIGVRDSSCHVGIKEVH